MSVRYLARCLQVRSSVIHGCRSLHTTPIRETFWERDKKGGYNRELERKFWKKDVILSGLQELKGEIKLWRAEVKERLQSDPILIHRPGEVDTAWSFKKPDDFNKWVLTTDSDHLEGESKAKFELSRDGHGIFHGTLSDKVPLDGRIKRAGYCNIKSMRARKSFKRETYLEWSQYNMLRMRVRGDGRSYLINIAAEGEYDVLWNDVYHYVLYTRGGPYWQDVKVSRVHFISNQYSSNTLPSSDPLLKVLLGLEGSRAGQTVPNSIRSCYRHRFHCRCQRNQRSWPLQLGDGLHRTRVRSHTHRGVCLRDVQSRSLHSCNIKKTGQHS